MGFTARMRRRLIGIVLAVGVALVALRWLPPSFVSEPQSAAAPPAATGQEARGDERFAALPSRAPLGAPRGALFGQPPRKPAPAAPAAEAKPVAPPLPYRVAGRLVHDGVSKVVLARGDRVLTVEQGDMLEGGYRVDAIDAEEVTLVYQPLGTRERLPIAATPTGAPAAAAPGAPAAAGGSVQAAQLRWDGPQRVRAGNTFSLALKVSSSEPLRGAPLRVAYDALLLEPLAVRPGKFFGADANFSYRIDPSGAIIVNASGAAASATDAELLILSFKPLRAAPSAEVRLAALLLQGPVGVSIPSEPLAAFRTAIAP